MQNIAHLKYEQTQAYYLVKHINMIDHVASLT